ncbi:MAG: hypothetical protein C4320_07070 [Armatimonadota bacterium]
MAFPFRDLRWFLSLTLASLVVVFFSLGSGVALWMVVGFFGTAGYLGGTWLAIHVATVFVCQSPRLAALTLGLALFLKVGPIVALALAARSAPDACRTGLLLGAAVVYSCLVGVGLRKVPSPPTDSP